MAINGKAGGFSLVKGGPQTAVLNIFDDFHRQGNWPALVQNFVDRQEIADHMFKPKIRAAMIEHLIERGVTMDDEQVLRNGGYDEHFAVAYEHAKNVADGANDPLQSAFGTGGAKASTEPWDFTVRTFSDVEAQGVIRENILAAGAIDYIYELGERMGVFQLTDALALRWSSGAIDVADGEAADKLYRYWKQREEHSSPEERGMLYKRVLNKGNAKVLDRMVVNETFSSLWRNLMGEVADYISKVEKIEDGCSSSSPVSRSSIFQAMRELQYNLTEFSTGMAHRQAHEIYFQLTTALDTLNDPEVIAHFGGSRRKSMWTVIKRLSKEELGRAVAIGPMMRLAVDGNKVFQTIANFDDGTITDQEFTEFIEAAESYILNSAVVGEEADFTDEDENDDFGDFEEFEDDF
jgi:hypothetical protein